MIYKFIMKKKRMATVGLGYYVKITTNGKARK